MWHEARKQEKIVRKVIVDYRRRAERRHEFYDKIKQDPTKFMQVHGKRLKLLIDENSLSNDTNSHMVPWQGDKANMIDRFDVRAHLDFIRDVPPPKRAVVDKEEAKLNYERYRILVYNQHKGISESQHLHKIYINETYPELSIQKQEAEAKKQLLQSTKASIGFDYGEDGNTPSTKEEEPEEEDSDVSSEEDELLSDLEEIPPLSDLNPPALQDLEKHSMEFGMGYTDFVKEMDQDQSQQARMDAAKALENEKLRMSGKKSRRERRVLRDKRLKNRIIGPLSYIQRDDSEKESGSGSESSASEDDGDENTKEGEIKFITSFGDNNDEAGEEAAPGTTDILPEPVSKTSKKDAKKTARKSRSKSRDRRSRSRDRHRRSRSRSRDYARSRWRSSGSHDTSCRSRSRERRRSRSRERRSRSRGRRSRSRDERSRSRSRRSRSRGRKSRERSPGKTATATLKSTTVAKASTDSAKKLTPQERLKLKMQKALKKQLKADKIAMADKRAQMFNEQMEREDELREMARKMRRKEEHRYDRDSSQRFR